ncbi:hypothetical protein PG999_005454 [Apiospora kogelbergensis]|uniref:Uncharacterized protein n=1 Tax=Apiospora kogelbergensis TaxID=1337665 RepID=A0AAW0R252_9PEZI
MDSFTNNGRNANNASGNENSLGTDLSFDISDYLDTPFDPFTASAQAQYLPYPQGHQYMGSQDGEHRTLLLLLLSRLDTIERILAKIDSAVERIKDDLHGFSRDVISIIRGCGFSESDPSPDEEQGGIV